MSGVKHEEPAPREVWIDALKGWGMLLIVVGHVWSLSDVPLWYLWIFSFHVPLFFFAAGMTIKPGSVTLRTFSGRRLRTLMLPYLVYALLGYLFYACGFAVAHLMGKTIAQFDYGLWLPLLGVFYGSVGDGLLVNSPLWFLPALFIALVAVYQANSVQLPSHVRYGIWAALFLLVAYVEESIRLPMSLVPAMAAALFVQLGLDYRKTDALGRLGTQARWWVLAGLFVITLWSPLNGAVGLAGPTINHPALFLLFALAGIGLSIILVRLPLGPWQGLMAFLGRHSMGILVLHMLAIKGVKVLLSIATGVGLDVMEKSVPWGILVLLIAALLMWPAIAVIERWLPWTLGNRTSSA